jgi:ribonuclease P protein component
MNCSFTKEQRLLKPKDFDYLRGGAERISTPFLRFYFKKSAVNSKLSRLGLSVSKKSGNAVQRNLIKRKLKNFFRSSDWREEGLDLLIVASPRLKEMAKDKDAVRAAINKSWRIALNKRFPSG